jgi:hypothetical protein
VPLRDMAAVAAAGSAKSTKQKPLARPKLEGGGAQSHVRATQDGTTQKARS